MFDIFLYLNYPGILWFKRKEREEKKELRKKKKEDEEKKIKKFTIIVFVSCEARSPLGVQWEYFCLLYSTIIEKQKVL